MFGDAINAATSAEVGRAQGMQPATIELNKALTLEFPGLATQGFNKRRIVGGKSWSLHATGRATDLFARHPNMRAMASLLPELPHIQRVIFYRECWEADDGRWSPYGSKPGQDDHTSHVHAELNRAGMAAKKVKGQKCSGAALWHCLIVHTRPIIEPGAYSRTLVPEIQKWAAVTSWRPLPPDGNYGPYSVQAVKQAQKAAGLQADGIIGPATWRKVRGK